MKEIDYDLLISESEGLERELEKDSDDGEIQLAGFKPDDFESTQLALQDRQALRRVTGLSTELIDISEAEYRRLQLERVVLVGVWTSGTALDAENSMTELAALAETAGSQVLDALIQRRDKADAATFIGSGKVAELKGIVKASGADTVICDGELSPSQLKNLEDRVKVKVVDRTALILDIFAQHAKSREGKAQVELAQMTYLLPRLRGWGQSLSRQAGGTGGIGSRGPGETKIEIDRRRIRDKMAKLRREIKEMKTSRDTKRQERERNKIPAVAIAGYTNAGKSSLLNRLTGAGVLVQDALFATLEPTVRRAETLEGRLFTIADTVGFVRDLPEQLVEVFKSTLEEVLSADLIVHLVDGSHPDPFGQIRSVRSILREIGAGGIHEIVAINKAEIAPPEVLDQLLRSERDAIAISVKTGLGIELLKRAIEDALPHPRIEIDLLIPYNRGDLVSKIHEIGEIDDEKYESDGTRIRGRVTERLAGELKNL
ncbi:MAG: GTPase HflX [Candidatus Nanopelagicaceae bacterium]